ncbi:MAG: helix-turn-helix domain-containing protein [Phycisphaeraceae bacterium]|nr:helix-turn-helix domain-containing protein [Phycisphaeraceae bacterium]
MPEFEEGIFDPPGRQILSDVLSLLVALNTPQRQRLAGEVRRLVDANRGDGVSTMNEAIRRTIVSAMFQAEGNITECARILDVERTWLYRKMNELGIR